MTPQKPHFTYVPNRVKTEKDSRIEIALAEGVMTDGRPWRMDYWSWEETNNITVFMSTEGIETYTKEQFIELLERERMVWFNPGVKKSAHAVAIKDLASNPMWSVNVCVGYYDDPARVDSAPLFAYPR